MTWKQTTIKNYNKNAKLLAERFDAFGSNKKEIVEIFSLVHKARPRVLELGCGNGRDAIEIKKYTNDYLGIDIAKEFIKLARKKVPQGKFRVADFEICRLPHEVDVVFAFASLVHCNKIQFSKILDRLYGVLSNDGTIYITLQAGRYQKFTRRDIYGARTFFFYEPEDVKHLASKKYKILKLRRKIFFKGRWLQVILQKRSISN